MFRSAVVKLTSVCNLNCSYCYMFNQGDLTYTRVPRNLPLPSALQLLSRIEDHLISHGKSRFHIALHGGEPTLWPVRNFEAFLKRVGEFNASGLELVVTVQTNALRMPESLLRLFQEHSVNIGVSLDGPAEYNDAMRVTHSGTGSYDRVMASVKAFIDKGSGHLLNGFLCVAPTDMEPGLFLDWVDDLPVRDIDVLWPMHFNYRNPPWGSRDNFEAYIVRPTIGEWFARLFKEWWTRDDPTLRIRLFEDCIRVLLGSSAHVDNIVNDSISQCVINTDGGIEYHDYFRSLDDGACRTRFNIHNDSLDAAASDPGFRFCLNLKDHLPAECSGCRHREICGGGFLPGRLFPQEAIPTRKSVLCFDQYHFFSILEDTVRPYLPEAIPTADV
jgi:uncharacterized protein